MMCTSCDELTMRLLNFIRSRGDAKGCQSRDVKKRGCTHNIGQTIVVLAVMEALLVISIHVRALVKGL